MFLSSQSEAQVSNYKETLKTIGSLSRLFSESREPYIESRIAENLFCKSFKAENLSRSDCSADASKNKIGIGIKTFLNKNGATTQKVAEFNSSHGLFSGLDDKAKVRKIAELRNERIATTKRIFGLHNIIYHCLPRAEEEIMAFETPMDEVSLESIQSVSTRGNVISFDDGKNEYSFNVAKSTLYKRFHTKDLLFSVPVKILDDPFDTLSNLFASKVVDLSFSPLKKHPHVFLPLYSTKSGAKIVPERSGLNQWNAAGRTRDADEVYLPIPAWIHKEYPNFFPGRDEPFVLNLPNGAELSAKVCQDGSKALMSNPNAALGEWLLRGVLGLKEGELLTYRKLEEIGLDSVVIYKTAPGIYDIDFTKIDSYEDFKGSDEDEEND
jgi:hypothetical protein